MLRVIRERTHSAGEELLTYLIEMAYLEVGERLRKTHETENMTEGANEDVGTNPLRPERLM